MIAAYFYTLAAFVVLGAAGAIGDFLAKNFL